jgi:hypothetical protein
MNLRQPYEQLIADKLRKLPAPDVNASWQEMKRLLDDNEDKGGGKRPPGNKAGWWRIGIIVIALSASLWLYVEKPATPGISSAKNNTTAPSTANRTPAEKGNSLSKNTTTSANNKTTTIDDNTTLSGTNTITSSKNNDKTTTAIIEKSNTADNIKNNIRINTATAVALKKTTENKGLNANRTEGVNNTAGIAVKNASPEITNKTNTAGRSVQPGQSTANRKSIDAGNSIVAGTKSSIKNKRTVAGTAGNNAIAINDNTETPVDISAGTATSVTPGRHTAKIKYIAGRENGLNDNKPSANHYFPVNQTAGIEDKTWLGQLTALIIPHTIPSANTSLAAGDSIANNKSANNLLNNATKKQVAKAQRDKGIEDLTKKEKKSFHLDLSNVFKPFSLHMDAEPRWAAGISLNSGITVNAQSRYNYNMNGKSGTLTDYIPSVYLQFHLNDYVYAQTEINFISPQYTPQLLVYQQSSDVTAMAGVSQQKSVYIQKLYYFNLPLSLHYSPINNFYFSAGLQFSSFQSGLVSVQEKQYATSTGANHPTSFSNTVIKFKDDSIAAKLSPNEWRWQLGAEYYWNRFTIGMRYNKSFKDLLNINLSNSLPATTLRNESLIFSLRYNLFESRKKGESSQKN